MQETRLSSERDCVWPAEVLFNPILQQRAHSEDTRVSCKKSGTFANVIICMYLKFPQKFTLSIKQNWEFFFQKWEFFKIEFPPLLVNKMWEF